LLFGSILGKKRQFWADQQAMKASTIDNRQASTMKQNDQLYNRNFETKDFVGVFKKIVSSFNRGERMPAVHRLEKNNLRTHTLTHYKTKCATFK